MPLRAAANGPSEKPRSRPRSTRARGALGRSGGLRGELGAQLLELDRPDTHSERDVELEAGAADEVAAAPGGEAEADVERHVDVRGDGAQEAVVRVGRDAQARLVEPDLGEQLGALRRREQPGEAQVRARHEQAARPERDQADLRRARQPAEGDVELARRLRAGAAGDAGQQAQRLSRARDHRQAALQVEPAADRKLPVARGVEREALLERAVRVRHQGEAVEQAVARGQLDQGEPGLDAEAAGRGVQERHAQRPRPGVCLRVERRAVQHLRDLELLGRERGRPPRRQG